MTASDQSIRGLVDSVFERSPLVAFLGIERLECGPGRCSARLKIRPEFQQQTGYVHAGIVSALGDQCAGAAAMSLTPDDCTVVTVEFKINLLRPAVGDWLLCRATVLKPGRTLSIVEAEIFCERAAGEPLLAAKLTATLAVIARP